MRITYLKLENVAGIYVGQGKTCIEIDMTRSKHRLTLVHGLNGRGKSVLLSSLTPFAGTSSTLDERGSLPYILPGKSGYKEIHYRDGNNEYVIRHFFKPTKDSHTVKSYFQLNGEELNENGNVGSFLSLVEIHFGLTPEMLRLIRLGTNVNSFVALKPAERKTYIGSLIEEIDLYLKIYKKINDDLRAVKVLMTSNATNLKNSRVTDPVEEGERIERTEQKIHGIERERDSLKMRISKLETLERENNIEDLRRQCREAEASMANFQRLDSDVDRLGLRGVTVEKLLSERSSLQEKQIETRSRINSLRLSIDSDRSRIENLNAVIQKISSNADIGSLTAMIGELRSEIEGTPDWVRRFPHDGYLSSDLSTFLSRLSAMNQISSMILSFGNKVISLYLSLYREGRSVDSFITEQSKLRLSSMGAGDIRQLLMEVFKDDYILSPPCVSEFEECPYYRLSTFLSNYNRELENGVCDEETLRYLRVIATNIDNMMNELDQLSSISVPPRFKEIMRPQNFLERLEKKLPFFDLGDIQEYLNGLRMNEIYRDQVKRLSQLEHELEIYRSSGVDAYVNEIRNLETSIVTKTEEIRRLETQLAEQDILARDLESKIGTVTSYNDALRYQGIVQSTLDNARKLLEPLESSAAEKRELRVRLEMVESNLEQIREEHRRQIQALEEYNRLIAEGRKLSSTYDKLSVIMTSVSTKKGIPLVYMNIYLDRIQRMTNNLLSIVYNGDLQVDRFVVTPDEFEIPFIRNGMRIPDIRYASQSELSLITMALSFALAFSVTQTYNIMLIDEMDAGLDEKNRLLFIRMLNRQMAELKAEQTFIISHNLSVIIADIPVDVIKLSEEDNLPKHYNVIYE